MEVGYVFLRGVCFQIFGGCCYRLSTDTNLIRNFKRGSFMSPTPESATLCQHAVLRTQSSWHAVTTFALCVLWPPMALSDVPSWHSKQRGGSHEGVLGVQVSWENEGGPWQGGVKHWPIAHLNGGIPGASSIAWVPLDGERKEHFSRCPAGKIWLWETSFRTHCLSEGCHSRWVLSKQREQGFEPENQQSLDNIVIGPCLFRGGWKPNWEQ